MPRRGRSASPPPAQRRPMPTRAAAPAPTPNVPARAAPSTPATMPPQQSAVGAPQQPSMFQQMAATAGGVAVGSAVGHTLGHGITSLFSGGGDKEAAQAPAQAVAPAQQQQQYTGSHPQDPQNPCAWEMKQFIECAQGQSDLTLCEGFNEALRQCKTRFHLQ